MTEKFASSKFADFTNVQELYRSQAGAVFRALFKYDQKEYVLKERKLPKYGNTKDIMNEVKLLSQLDHSNVIRCEGWFRDESRQSIFIVLEFCAGGDLNSVILKQRTEGKYFDESQIWDIFYQLCVGLKHLHEHGIIHRDLKPLNIFCSRSGQTFKIGDLGVSRQVSEDTMMLKSFYGTPLYLSPELVDNKPYNEKTDIWSLGVILYELCALQPPFKGNTLLDVAKLVSHGRYSPIPKHYSAHLTKCVAWMLNLDFNKRPNVAQLLAFVELRRPVATAAAVSPQRKNRNTKSKRRPAAGQKPTAVEVQIQQQDDDDNCNFVPAADGYGGGHGSDSDDTRMDDDSLEEGRGGRDEGNRNRKNEKKGEGQEQQQGSGGGKQATNQRAANLAGNNRDSDNDRDTESDCTLPQEEEEEELVPFKQHARVAHNNSSSSYRNNCGGRGAKPNSEKGVHKKEKVASQPSAIPAIVDPIPRRQNIRELRQDRNSAAPALPLAAPSVVVDSAAAANKEHAVAVAGQRRERGAIPKQIQQQQAPLPSSASAASAVTVQADCQRLQVLLRRELTTLRKLLQIRDFVALKFNGENDTDLLPDEVCSREGEGEGGGGVVDRIKLAQFNAQVLEKAINCNGMISETYAKR